MARTPLTEGDGFGPVEVRVTRTDLVRYAGASGDFNPIHHSDRAARELGLDTPIAHGMWTMGRALSEVSAWLESTGRTPDDLAGYFVRFTRPVPVPDTAEGTAITIAGRVVTVVDDLAVVQLEVSLDDQTVLGNAKVEVRA
ncbi:MaoC/PaaZ C-terminal domain-containing protein [Aestuariimicrobium kwangyangense]|uniref:MaoC/PaaZ C-terminal domain-containing protein n=1 Tax=Aestuariimicrobium kwangyangense TaxID=396389 RepID=UPI0003B69AAE|nr:MaoC/PaaZ C-terminal domain-containing protein [Aestuariimicrobium kwangyangense]